MKDIIKLYDIIEDLTMLFNNTQNVTEQQLIYGAQCMLKEVVERRTDLWNSGQK